MKPPIVGYALGHTWVVMLVVVAVSGSVVTMTLVGLAVYPFFHLGVKVWHASKSKQGASNSKRTGVRGWGQ